MRTYVDLIVRTSRFNYSIELPDGTFLLFNFFTLALIAFSRSEAATVEKILGDPGAPSWARKHIETAALLLAKGFLINDGVDELRILKDSFHREREQHKRLSLTIIPTLSCNFRCIYCYEPPSASTMTEETEEALVGYVQRKLHPGGTLSVTWFGGAPLLKMDTIGRLSTRLLDLSARKDAHYSSRVITNGYLLDYPTVDRLLGFRVKSAQVTLDGPPEVHDSRRPLRTGGGTFHHVLGNIAAASERMSISVRMNVDQQNRNSIPEIIAVLKQKGLHRKVGFYLWQTTPYTDTCVDIAGWCMRDDDFSLLGLETQMSMIEQGFTSSFGLPRSRNIGCMAECGNSFVLVPSGGVAKCWNEVGHPRALVDHLSESLTFYYYLRMRAREQEAVHQFQRMLSAISRLDAGMNG